MQHCWAAFLCLHPRFNLWSSPPFGCGMLSQQGRRQRRPCRVSGLPHAMVPIFSPRARRGGPREPDAVPEAGGGVPHRAAAVPDAGAVPQVLHPAQQEPPRQRESARGAGPAEHAQGGSPQPPALPQPLHGCPKNRLFPWQAKLAELQALEQLLDDDTLTSEKFRRWKEEHQDLYQELQECWAQRQGQGGGGGDPKAEQSSPGEAAKP